MRCFKMQPIKKLLHFLCHIVDVVGMNCLVRTHAYVQYILLAVVPILFIFHCGGIEVIYLGHYRILMR